MIGAVFHKIKLFDLLNERKIIATKEDGKQNISIPGLIEKKLLIWIF